MPPWALMYSAYPVMASTLPWKNPGASGDPVSAITSMVMVSGVTPTSEAASGSDSQAAATSSADGPPTANGASAEGVLFPPESSDAPTSLPDRPQADSSSTTASTGGAQRHPKDRIHLFMSFPPG